MDPDGVVTRGDLPHWYKPGHAHFITYRLVDTIPVEKLAEWRARRHTLLRQERIGTTTASEHSQRIHKRFFAEYDRYLDAGSARQWLADRRVTAIVRENLYHHHGTKYQLLAWCIMPNHVHVVLQPLEISNPDEKAGCNSSDAEAGNALAFSDELSDALSPLSRIMHSLKSYTANEANRLLGRTGQFWQHESYDHWIRDIDELERIVAYVRHNPVQARLCQLATEWVFSSAHDCLERDGSDSALVGWLTDNWRGK